MRCSSVGSLAPSAQWLSVRMPTTPDEMTGSRDFLDIVLAEDGLVADRDEGQDFTSLVAQRLPGDPGLVVAEA